MIVNYFVECQLPIDNNKLINKWCISEKNISFLFFSLLCYKEEIAALNVVKPGINTDQSEWRSGIETTAEILQNRIEVNLRLDELKYD